MSKPEDITIGKLRKNAPSWKWHSYGVGANRGYGAIRGDDRIYMEKRSEIVDEYGSELTRWCVFLDEKTMVYYEDWVKQEGTE